MDVITCAFEFSSLAPCIIEDEVVISSYAQNYENSDEMNAREVRNSKDDVI